jgi:hypothetical protein
VTSPEHRFWDSIHDPPREDTSALRAAIAKLTADADADVGVVVEALKMGVPERREVPPAWQWRGTTSSRWFEGQSLWWGNQMISEFGGAPLTVQTW